MIWGKREVAHAPHFIDEEERAELNRSASAWQPRILTQSGHPGVAGQLQKPGQATGWARWGEISRTKLEGVLSCEKTGVGILCLLSQVEQEMEIPVQYENAHRSSEPHDMASFY